MTTTPSRPAVVFIQQLKDSTWVGNAAFAGRTITDGGADEPAVLRRLHARLSAMPGGAPDVVKLSRIQQGGQREDKDVALGSLVS
jgi:hypothetical protein